MKQSNFRFSNPIINKIDYQLNHEFKHTDDLTISNSFNVNISRDPNANISVVDLRIVVGEKELLSTLPFYIDVVISAMFTWDDVYDESTVQSLLSINAPALLLGYARPLISTITNMSPFPTYNLPFFNFTEE